MVRALAAALTLLLSSCAELGLVPAGVPAPPLARPVLRPERSFSPTFGAAQVAHRRVDGVRLELLTVGRGRVRGNLVSELKSPQARLRPPVMVGVVRHPKAGVILFGAGLPEDLGGLGAAKVPGSALSPVEAPPGRDIVSQLSARGVDVSSVSWVIVPALAPEWAGRAGAFPNATVVASAKAWADPKRRELEIDMPDPRAFVPEERLKTIDLEKDPPFGPLEHGHDLLGDGTLILVDLDGGAAGGMGLWLNLDSGPVLLTGPGAFVYDNVFDDALPAREFVVDVSSFAWNTRAMRAAKDSMPRLVIVPAHDPATLRISPRPDVLLVP